MAVTLPQLRQHLTQTKQFGADERAVFDKLIQYLEDQATADSSLNVALDGSTLKLERNGLKQGAGVTVTSLRSADAGNRLTAGTDGLLNLAPAA